MQTDAVLKEVEERITSYNDLPWLSYYTDMGSHRPDGPPEGSISFQEIGKWLVIVLIYRWEAIRLHGWFVGR